MKAAYFLGKTHIAMEEEEIPTPQPGEVLVDIQYSALCGSDLGPYRCPESMKLPAGHEMIGRVVHTTNGCSLKPGDRVAIYVLNGCGSCVACRHDHVIFCPKLGFIIGGHREFMAVPERSCIRIPEEIPDEAAILLAADTVGVAFHACTQFGVERGERVLIIGAGPVGLGAISLMSYFGADITVVDVNDYRLDFAKTLGEISTINPLKTDALEMISEMTEGRGCSMALECVGKNETLNLALDAAAPHGRIAICGEADRVSISPSRQFIHKELTMFGSWYFRFEDVPRLFDLYRQGFHPEPLISHRYPLEQIHDAYEAFSEGQTAKVVLVQA